MTFFITTSTDVIKKYRKFENNQYTKNRSTLAEAAAEDVSSHRGCVCRRSAWRRRWGVVGGRGRVRGSDRWRGSTEGGRDSLPTGCSAGTYSLQRTARNVQPGTYSLERTACNGQPRTYSPEHTARNTWGNVQPATNSVQRTARNVQPGTYSLERTACNEQPGTYSSERTARNVQPATYSLQ